jgi:hypothetical protein
MRFFAFRSDNNEPGAGWYWTDDPAAFRPGESKFSGYAYGPFDTKEDAEADAKHACMPGAKMKGA